MTLSVGHRIIGGFGLIILLVFGLGWYQLVNIERMKDEAVNITDGEFAALNQLRNLEIGRRQMAVQYENSWATYFLGKAGVGREDTLAAQKEWALTRDRLAEQIKSFDAFTAQQAVAAGNEARRKVWVGLREANQALSQSVEESAKITADLFGLIQRDSISQYPSYHDLLIRQRARFEQDANRLGELISGLTFDARGNIIAARDDIRTTSIIAVVIVLVIGVVVATLLYRSVTSPLRDFMRFVESVGSGDLTRKLENVPADELGRLGTHLNEMVDSLNGIAKQIRGATENLNAAAAEMQSSVQQQSAGTNEQNAAIQQITSTLSEITRSGSQISDRAKAVAQTAEAAAAASKSGIQAVNETTRAMTTIREQAEKVAGQIVALTEKTQSIGAIISTVNDLSERSNLLALNAAIEAAAAGEHGQSFAVVADEMKNLATQAKEATVEVRLILGDIQHGIGIAVMQTEEAVKRVESGKEQAVATEQTINNLARSVEQSVATFEQIVAATGQQQVGIEQVTQSIHSIREASEQMSSGSKEVGRAASTLAALSSQLQRVVERYQV
jgi:methyl-accepting chemotaxis protein